MCGSNSWRNLLSISVGFFLVASLTSVKDCQAAVTDESWAEIEKRLGELEKRPGFSFNDETIGEDELKELRESFGSTTEEIVEGLDLLDKFREIVHGRKCDREAKELRESLNLKFEGKFERLDDMVNYFSTRNARNCARIYLGSYRRLQENYPFTLGMERMRLFFSELIYATVTERSRFIRGSLPFRPERQYLEWMGSRLMERIKVYRLFIKESSQLPYHTWHLIGDIAFDSVDVLAGKEKNTELVKRNSRIADNGRRIIDANGAKELFSRLILDSCKEFVEVYEPSVFGLAEFDIKYTGLFDVITGRSTEIDLFYIAWAQYKVCSRLISNDQDRSRLLDMLGEIADEEARRREGGGQEARIDTSGRNFYSDFRGSEIYGMATSDLLRMFEDSDIPGQIRDHEEASRNQD